jgi:hypothetical protein
MSKRQKALANVSKLASIGIQAIEAQRARKAWLATRSIYRGLMKEFLMEGGEHYVDSIDSGADRDEGIDNAIQTAANAAFISRREAQKLRRMIKRYEAGL